jgi:hypothetical protein
VAISYSLGGGGTGQLNGAAKPKKVPLSGSSAQLFKYYRDNLRFLLNDPHSACSQFLKNTFGFNGTRIAKALLGLKVFDADASTISMGAAGLVPYHNPNTGAVNPYFNQPVNEFVKTQAKNGLLITFIHAGFSARQQRDIYYSNLGGLMTPQGILHEALHMFTGGRDEDLAKKLHVDIKDGDTSSISEALKNGGCTNEKLNWIDRPKLRDNRVSRLWSISDALRRACGNR